MSSLEWLPQVGAIKLEGMPAGGNGSAAEAVADRVVAVLGVAKDVRSRWRKESSTSKSPSVLLLLLLVDVVVLWGLLLGVFVLRVLRAGGCCW